MNHVVAQIKSARTRYSCAVRAIAAISLAFLGGCAWFLPHPQRSSNAIGDAETARDGRCSLAVAQTRKALFGQISADGVPRALIIHSQPSGDQPRN
jgi:hypothetical protein